MTIDVVQRLRRYIPSEAELLNHDDLVGLPRGRAFSSGHIDDIETGDGGLVCFTEDGRCTSSDGGKTWSSPQVIHFQGDGRFGGLRHPQRLRSGAIGAFTKPMGEDKGRPGQNEGQYGHSLWFTRSEDEGENWSDPVMVSEPYNNAVMHGATVTHTGRIVVSAYNLVGEHLREKWVNVEGSRAMYGDELISVGPHGFDAFMTYCWAYLSDDEGASWRTNDRKGVWAAGGELFVNRDHSAGGHWRANEPVVAEVSDDHLLMLQRTPLGRLYQSWSSDNGTTWSQSEPTSLASALAPAALVRLPSTGDLLVIWNQASRDEIERGMSRIRLSSAISKDGGASWLRGRNVFSQYGEDDRRYVDPPPIGNYRAMELAPRLPDDIAQATYPNITLWRDRVTVRFRYGFQNDPNDSSTQGEGDSKEIVPLGGPVRISMPVSWFYERLKPFG